ncbi:MAG: hypothetical protein WC565_06575 [Parcubacteria group bacterium]
MPREGFESIRRSKEERERWYAEAAAEGTNFSEWARRKLNEPSQLARLQAEANAQAERVARLQAQVDRMADDLATFQEFFRARRAGEPPIPQPESVTEGWEGQSGYQHKEAK